MTAIGIMPINGLSLVFSRANGPLAVLSLIERLSRRPGRFSRRLGLVLEPGGGTGIRKACLEVSNRVGNGEGPAILVVRTITADAVAPVAHSLLFDPELIAADETALHFDGLAAVAGEIAERLHVYHVGIDGGGGDSPFILGDEAHLATAVIDRIGANPPVCRLDFTAGPFESHRTLTAAVTAGAAIEAGDIFAAASLAAQQQSTCHAQNDNQANAFHLSSQSYSLPGITQSSQKIRDGQPLYETAHLGRPTVGQT